MSHEVTPGGLPKKQRFRPVDEEEEACLPALARTPASASRGSSPEVHSQGPGDRTVVLWTWPLPGSGLQPLQTCSEISGPSSPLLRSDAGTWMTVKSFPEGGRRHISHEHLDPLCQPGPRSAWE